jgi:hypothetical protein
MFQLAEFIACQMPFKFGFPSAVRGALYVVVVCPGTLVTTEKKSAEAMTVATVNFPRVSIVAVSP